MTPPPKRLEYLTDLEGDWDKLADFCAKSGILSLDADGALELRPDSLFVYGGDTIDHGPASRRIVDALNRLKRSLAAKGRAGEFVIIAGNRDLNKIRLATELTSDDPERLKAILQKTMGAPKAFEQRRRELGPHATDLDVVRDFRGEVGSGGRLRELLWHAQLAFRSGEILVVHGAVTDDNFLAVPDGTQAPSVDAWVEALNAWYREELARFGRTEAAPELVAYQRPVPGRRDNPRSIVYGHYSDATMNPVLPSPSTLASLRREGIRWVLSGHRPYGESPSILSSTEGVRFVLADNSHMPTSHASVVALADGALHVLSQTHVEEKGPEHPVRFELRPDEPSPLGLRTADGFLVRARLGDGRYLLARVRKDFSRDERLVSAGELAGAALSDPTREH